MVQNVVEIWCHQVTLNDIRGQWTSLDDISCQERHWFKCFWNHQKCLIVYDYSEQNLRFFQKIVFWFGFWSILGNFTPKFRVDVGGQLKAKDLEPNNSKIHCTLHPYLHFSNLLYSNIILESQCSSLFNSGLWQYPFFIMPISKRIMFSRFQLCSFCLFSNFYQHMVDEPLLGRLSSY